MNKVMTQEEKFLLLQDLCARLPYGTKCYNRNTEEVFTLSEATDTTDISNVTFDYGYCNIHYIQPYLRPMSSMTEEEEEELRLLKNQLVDCDETNDEKFYGIINEIHNLYLSHHIDFMGLITKGLAIEVTESSNPYK